MRYHLLPLIRVVYHPCVQKAEVAKSLSAVKPEAPSSAGTVAGAAGGTGAARSAAAEETAFASRIEHVSADNCKPAIVASAVPTAITAQLLGTALMSLPVPTAAATATISVAPLALHSTSAPGATAPTTVAFVAGIVGRLVTSAFTFTLAYSTHAHRHTSTYTHAH